MKTFMLIFHGYHGSSPELEAAWDRWFQRRAASFADVGHPFGPGRRITNETTIEWSLASNLASGYSIVVAPHIDAAEQLLEGCPIVESVTLYEALPRRMTAAQCRGSNQQRGNNVMRNIKVERTVAAPPSKVWAVLADYANIMDWNPGVVNSYAIGDKVDGVGAQRQTELAPDGAMRMRETVTEWAPEERLVVAIDEIEQQPIMAATMAFTLSDGGETTPLTMSYDYEAAAELGTMLDEQFSAGFNGLIDSLERAAQAPRPE